MGTSFSSSFAEEEHRQCALVIDAAHQPTHGNNAPGKGMPVVAALEGLVHFSVLSLSAFPAKREAQKQHLFLLLLELQELVPGRELQRDSLAVPPP